MKIFSALALFLILATAGVRGFAPVRSGMNVIRRTTLTAGMAAVDEAVALFQERYPKRNPSKNGAWVSWGMPNRDIDGTKYKVAEGGLRSGRTLYDLDEKDQRATFREIAKVYGESRALEMCKAVPGVLAFDRKNFAPSFREYAKVFGEDDAKAMVQRNPGLLAVKPTGYGGADSASDQTMQMSYVMAATRPAGPLLLGTLLTLLSIPAIENVTGIPFRANVLASLLGS